MRIRSSSTIKKKQKISDEDFDIPNISNYSDFLDTNYNVKQLKSILKFYKLKVSGNKNELSIRVYDYMKESYYSTIIQRQFRAYIILKYYGIMKSRPTSDYSNETDFYTMENINELSSLYLYSYKDKKGFSYAFKINSLIQYFKSSEKKNPYNRDPFPQKVIDDITYIGRICKVYTNLCDTEMESEPILSRKQKISLKLTDLFHIIDSLGNYSDINWLLNLHSRRIAIFIRELFDIWNYRAQLSEEAKKEICPPNGSPFHQIDMSMITRHQPPLILLEKCILIFENLLKSDTSSSNKSVAALFILSAITLVSQDAADAMPWLYQSVA
jgi:hypothetical protein